MSNGVLLLIKLNFFCIFKMQNKHTHHKNFFIHLILETSALSTRFGNNLKFHLEKQTGLEKPSNSAICSKAAF